MTDKTGISEEGKRICERIAFFLAVLIAFFNNKDVLEYDVGLEGLELYFVIVIYFSPTIIAWHRYNKVEPWKIFGVNTFLGWTIVGWVFSLICAIKAQSGDESDQR